MIELPYHPPLAFEPMLRFLAARALPGIERIGAGSYERVFGPAQAPLSVRVSAAGDAPTLLLAIPPAPAVVIEDVITRVRRMFALDLDCAAVDATLSAEPVLAGPVARHPGLRMPGGWDGFETLVRAVLGQQVSVAAATTLTGRLVETFGGKRSREGFAARVPLRLLDLDRIFPTPAQLVDAPLESIGLPRARASTFRTAAAAVLDGRLDFSPGQTLKGFVERCVSLPGIGPWTAHYVAMRGLGHRDAFPAGDLVLRRMLGGERRLTMRAAASRADAWRPWRAIAVMHLWNLAADQASARRSPESASCGSTSSRRRSAV